MTDSRALLSGHAEAKLTSLSNREDGGIRMGFVIQPDDVTDALRRARPGTFFVLGYQEFDPDAKEPPARKKRKKLLSEECALHCQRPDFQNWLGVKSERAAKVRVYDSLHIESRKELDTDAVAAERWKRMEASFRFDAMEGR